MNAHRFNERSVLYAPVFHASTRESHTHTQTHWSEIHDSYAHTHTYTHCAAINKRVKWNEKVETKKKKL